MARKVEFYRQILENECTAVVLVNQQHKILYLNTAAELLFTRSGKRVEGLPLPRLFHPKSQLPDLTESAESGGSYTQREARWQLAGEQEPITVDYTVSPILFDMEPCFLLEVLPIDRLKRISRDEEILAKQETTRHLVRGVAHEIKNPLGGIRGAAQLLARELPDESLKDYTSVIIEEADRLRNLVDQMLGSSKLPTRTMINIHEVLERIFSLIYAEVGNRIKLVRDYDPSVPEFMADREQMIQALLNIVRNAMQALTETVTENAEICLKTRVVRQFTIGQKAHKLVCRIDILDNGPGIPNDIVENIFYPMISGRAGGTGLGLSIAQQIVSQHGGIIECASEPGKTRFSVFLPLGETE